MRRKYAMTVATVSLVALGLAACSPGSQESGTSTGNGDEDVTLGWNFWVQGEAADAAWEALADEVTEHYPNISVELNQVPFGDYFTRYQSQLAAGEAACIVGMQSLRLPAFAETMEPLDEYLEQEGFDESEWNEGALTALQREGSQYAIPIGFSTMQMFYNKDLFAEAGVDEPTDGWTIEDFESAAVQITEETGVPAFGQSFSDMHMFSMLYAYNGATPVTSEGELDLTSDEMHEAFAWYASLSTELGVASTPASSAEVPWGEQQWLAGNVAMAVDGTWNTASNATDTDFEVGVVTLPAGEQGVNTFSANSGFGVTTTCEHPQEAVQAITVLTNEESAVASAEAGNETARLSGQETYYEGLGESVSEEYKEQAQETAEASSAVAQPFVSTDNWEAVVSEISRQFILAYTGDQPAADALEATQQAAGN
ncbi:ABC transporter substrate-binding protein [Pseudactinotalea sp. Z1748]|uniref:ABC transporter substrate-binding protein n=1 Tax=Pseudactinotalea sp. Z1748 TaxID=3413027 RepID=UPI003C7E4B53